MVQLTLTDGFQGTLEELLRAAEKGTVDAATLNLAEVSGQALAAGADAQRDVDVLSDAAAAIARLVQLKAQALLPRPEVAAPPDVDHDPATEPAELARMLEEYRLFRAAAEGFRGRELEGLRSFPRLAPPPSLPPPAALGNLTLESLMGAVRDALARQPKEPVEAVPRLTITVRERLEALQQELRDAGRINFSAYMRSCRSRIEVIIGFMAVLELIRHGAAHAEQPEPFGDIVIAAGPPDGTGD